MTPHPVHLRKGGHIITYQPEPNPVRCQQSTQVVENLIDQDGNVIPITITTYGAADYLPPPKKNTYLIVSKIIAEKFRGKRKDLLIPNGVQVNQSGTITGCISLTKI